jgi:tetratricopeptide (TPR) repeat protein
MTLVLLLAATAYIQTLQYQFVWDDGVMVLQRLELRDWPRLVWADFTTLTGGAMEGHYYRPVLALSLGLDAVLWGDNPAPFHLTNILLHVLVTYLVFYLVLAMGARQDVGIATALVFAIHPAHVEVVAFVAARGDLLMSVGVLACLLAYRRSATARRVGTTWTVAALAAYGCALLSKESALAVPPLLLLSDALAPPFGLPDRIPWRRALVRVLPFLGLSLAFVALRFSQALHLGSGQPQGGRLWGRLPGSLEILARYFGLSLAPLHMQPFYSLPRPTALLDPGPLLGLLVAGLLVGLLVRTWRSAPLVAFGGGWFLATILPVLDLVPLSFREMGLADRYLYLPSVGVCVLLAVTIVAVMGPIGDGSRALRRLAGWCLLGVVLLFWSWSLLLYAPVWRDNVTLYQRMVQAAPRAPIPALNLGLAYFRAKDYPRAVSALEQAVRLNPTLGRPRTLLALLYVLQGHTSEGFRQFEVVASLGLPERDYYVSRTMAHLSAGQAGEALRLAEEGLRRFPADADLRQWLGLALEQSGRPAEAQDSYRHALAIRPDLFESEEALGRLAARAGQGAEAIQHLLRSLEIRPDRIAPMRTLALLLEEQGRTAEALGLWRQILVVAPTGTPIREAAQHICRLEGRPVCRVKPSADTHRPEGIPQAAAGHPREPRR